MRKRKTVVKNDSIEVLNQIQVLEPELTEIIDEELKLEGCFRYFVITNVFTVETRCRNIEQQANSWAHSLEFAFTRQVAFACLTFVYSSFAVSYVTKKSS